MRDRILKAMRADTIPSGCSGRWSVRKHHLTDQAAKVMAAAGPVKGRERLEPAGSYTHLQCFTGELEGNTTTVMNVPAVHELTPVARGNPVPAPVE